MGGEEIVESPPVRTGSKSSIRNARVGHDEYGRYSAKKETIR
ncbi:hypothetical protein [Georgenia daeguensis]